METKNKLTNEVVRLIDNCQLKREILQLVNHKNSEKKKRMTVIAGVLSIASAVLMTSLVTEVVSARVVEFLSVAFAATAGVVALNSSTIQNDAEVSNIHSGSSKYLVIREKASYLLIDQNTSPEDVLKELQNLVEDYLSLSEVYDKYIIGFGLGLHGSTSVPDEDNMLSSGHVASIRSGIAAKQRMKGRTKY